MLLNEKDAKRFWSKVDIRLPDECWPWLAYIDRLGYGRFKVGGKKGKAIGSNRVAAALSKADFDPDAHYLHSCDNRACCNPAHLRAGTHQDNVADMVARDRHRSPRPGNGYQKLSDDDYAEIKRRFLSGDSKSAIARSFSVSSSLVSCILKRK